MKFIYLVMVYVLASCSGGGEGGGESKGDKKFDRDGLPDGDVVKVLDFQKMVSNHNPLSGRSYSFKGEFIFDKKGKSCRGKLDSTISTQKMMSSVTTSGYCPGKTIRKKIGANLELLNLEKIHDALREELKVIDLGKNEYRVSFENQKNWTRSYTFKIDKKSKTILFPVTLRYRFNDGAHKMKWTLIINKGKGEGPSSDKFIDVMDLAESGLYGIY